MSQGLVHLYWDNGKGKTTAAMGLALRALSHGQKVVILQFCKDGCSGEIELLRRLGAEVLIGKPEKGFTWELTAEEKQTIRTRQNELLRQAMESGCDLLILDEACAALRLNLVEEDLLKAAVLNRPEGREVVLTGRDPAGWMLEAADYCTQMRCEKHPYGKGIPAREGVEF